MVGTVFHDLAHAQADAALDRGDRALDEYRGAITEALGLIHDACNGWHDAAGDYEPPDELVTARDALTQYLQVKPKPEKPGRPVVGSLQLAFSSLGAMKSAVDSWVRVRRGLN